MGKIDTDLMDSFQTLAENLADNRGGYYVDHLLYQKAMLEILKEDVDLEDVLQLSYYCVLIREMTTDKKSRAYTQKISSAAKDLRLKTQETKMSILKKKTDFRRIFKEAANADDFIRRYAQYMRNR